MRQHSNRLGVGTAPIACPDCNATAVPTPGAPLPGPAPRVQHEPTCPIARAAERLFASDLRWLDAHPDAPGRVRHLHPCEADDMATALGKRVSRQEQREWRVAVVRRGRGVARAYVDGRGRARAVQVSQPTAAGAR